VSTTAFDHPVEDFASLPGFLLRPLDKKDIPEFIELGLPTCSFMHGRPDVPEQVMRKNFTSFVGKFAFEDESEIWVVEAPDGLIAAQLWLRISWNRFNDINEMWIWDITVKEEYQGKGMGRALLNFAKLRATETFCRELWLLVSGKNDKASQLYKSEGFAISGHLMSVCSTSIHQDDETKQIGINSICLKPLRGEHVEQLCRLWDAAGLPYRKQGRDEPQRLKRYLNGSRETGWGAFDGDKLVGAALASYDGRKGWIERLAVLPDYRRTGLAKALIVAVTQTLQKAGAMIIAALILESNTASRQLFETCGYKFDPTVCYYTKRDNPDS
jgi:N-acetylglutamate synthase